MTTTLVPPDQTRCQAEITKYNPWVMGGSVNITERCSNKPVVIAVESKPGLDGLTGSMSLCASCRDAMLISLGVVFCTFKELKL